MSARFLVKTYRSWSKINDRAALDAYVRRAMVNTLRSGRLGLLPGT